MSRIYKIVFVGPEGAGKTQALTVLSDTEVLSTAAVAADEVGTTGAEASVAMEQGLLNLTSGECVRLYGTAGLRQPDFIDEILSQDALGVVLLLDGSAPEPVADLRACVGAFRHVIDETALVVGITHSSWGDRHVRPMIAAELTRLGLPATVMNVDARERAEMVTLVKTLIYSLDPLLEVSR